MLVILRGVSGAGKTTFAKREFPTAIIASADDTFTTPTGEYNFDFTRLTEAHVACFCKVDGALGAGKLVVVDNTNTQRWEMSPYIMLANKHGVPVRIIRFECDPEKAAARNTHSVPDAAVQAMHERMEEPLPFWGEEEVVTT